MDDVDKLAPPILVAPIPDEEPELRVVPSVEAPPALDYATVPFRGVKPEVDGTIDCEINHPVYGWIPFTASETDAEPAARVMMQRLRAGP